MSGGAEGSSPGQSFIDGTVVDTLERFDPGCSRFEPDDGHLREEFFSTTLSELMFSVTPSST